MQINLPDNLKITSKAAAAGFSDVESYVRHLIETDGYSTSEEHNSQPDAEIDYEVWENRFNTFLACLEPGNPNFDDSRESIYPVR